MCRPAWEQDCAQNHRRDNSHGIGFKQVCGHAGAIADIVANVVGDRCRVAWIIFRNAGFNLADQIAANVSALGEDAAAQTRKDRDQRSAETQSNERVDDFAIIEK
jgi:hypothetical protein